MLSIGKIIGFPLKIFDDNKIHIPSEYLRYYGISGENERLLLKISEHSLFYSPLSGDGANHAKKETRAIRGGLTHLPAEWARLNGLKVNDFIFIIGLEKGLLVYTGHRIVHQVTF